MALFAALASGVAHAGALCAADLPREGPILGLFLAGAAGGAMHCGPMCGGFVLGQVADRMARVPAAALCERRRFAAALLWPYHLGRMTTYAALGAAAAATLGAFRAMPWFAPLRAGVLALAAVLFLAEALRRLAPGLGLPATAVAPAGWGRWLGRWAGRLGAGAGATWLRGVLLGLLPCGFLYGALTAAAAAGTPLRGALGMAAFAAGTVPALAAVGLLGQAAGRRFGARLGRVAPAVLLLNAGLLAALAWSAA
ncbi:MAG: sulfite exporter TauE/SafE family protein [Acetobacteraceae bacterium]